MEPKRTQPASAVTYAVRDILTGVLGAVLIFSVVRLVNRGERRQDPAARSAVIVPHNVRPAPIDAPTPSATPATAPVIVSLPSPNPAPIRIVKKPETRSANATVHRARTVPSPIPSPPISEPPTAKPDPPAQATDTQISEPEARDALNRVGTDPKAEKVWVQAINDRSLPAEQRQNLIEDLNETGFPDPKNVTPADLPLIQARLALIDRLAPDAIDDVNRAAFQEARKDLTNMYDRLTTGG